MLYNEDRQLLLTPMGSTGLLMLTIGHIGYAVGTARAPVAATQRLPRLMAAGGAEPWCWLPLPAAIPGIAGLG
jgi:hypothetical protein